MYIHDIVKAEAKDNQTLTRKGETMQTIISEASVLVGFGGKFGLSEIRETRTIARVTRGVFDPFPAFSRPADKPSIGCYTGDDFYLVLDADGRPDEQTTKLNLGSRV